MSAHEEVYQASERFHAGPLSDIWSHSELASTMHPVGGLQVGWDAVRQSWEQIAPLASGGQVTLNDQIIQIVGDVAYELGFEYGQMDLAGEHVAIDHRVTNLYCKEAGGWKIILHHTDLSPAMQEALDRIQAGEHVTAQP
jgi:ketosteroid isomerase-like protein